MPVRKIPRNGRSLTGCVSPGHGSRSIGYESRLEHDCLLLLLFDPDLAGIEEQPLTISYDAPGQRRGTGQSRYTPDFLVRYQPASGRRMVLVEVKYHEQLRTQSGVILPKIRAGQRHARERGWRFRVFTERHIRGRRTYLTNVEFLLPFRQRVRDAGASQRLLDHLAGLGCSRAEDLLTACKLDGRQERARYIACLWRLLATHEVAADLNQPLTLTMSLFAPTHRPQPTLR